MSLKMPEPDAAVLARRAEIVRDLVAIVPGEGVIAHEREMRPYESDGLTAYRQLPFVVVLPETTEQVSQVLRYCHAHGIRVVRCRWPTACCSAWASSTACARSTTRTASWWSSRA
jgi:glycolate oxidase